MRGYRFSFMCDCNPNTIVWINRMYIREDCTIVFSGVCYGCGKVWDSLDLTAVDVIKLAAEAKVDDGGNGEMD